MSPSVPLLELPNKHTYHPHLTKQVTYSIQNLNPHRAFPLGPTSRARDCETYSAQPFPPRTTTLSYSYVNPSSDGQRNHVQERNVRYMPYVSLSLILSSIFPPFPHYPPKPPRTALPSTSAPRPRPSYRTTLLTHMRAEKSTWWGCGQHVPMVMDTVAKESWCTCEPKVEREGVGYPPMGKRAD